MIVQKPSSRVGHAEHQSDPREQMNTLFQPIGYYAPIGEMYIEGYMTPIDGFVAPIPVDKSWADDDDQDLPPLDMRALAIDGDDGAQGPAKELGGERPSTSLSTSTYVSSTTSLRSTGTARRCGFCKQMGHSARWNSAVTCPALKAKLLRQQQEADTTPKPAAECAYCKEQGHTARDARGAVSCPRLLAKLQSDADAKSVAKCKAKGKGLTVQRKPLRVHPQPTAVKLSDYLPAQMRKG